MAAELEERPWTALACLSGTNRSSRGQAYELRFSSWTWGIGAGWEAPLDYLGKFLRGELPDAPAAEWWEPTPEDAELGNRRGHAWAAVVEAALTASRTETMSAQGRT